MRKTHRQIFIFAALILWLFVAGCTERPQAGRKPVGTGDNLIALHDSSSPQYREDCLSCHNDVLSEASLSPSIASAHLAMLPNVPGDMTEDKCVHCHTTVDILQHSAGNIRRNVAVQLCDQCHGPGKLSTKQYYQK